VVNLACVSSYSKPCHEDAVQQVRLVGSHSFTLKTPEKWGTNTLNLLGGNQPAGCERDAYAKGDWLEARMHV
jgi:hypothetical protein